MKPKRKLKVNANDQMYKDMPKRKKVKSERGQLFDNAEAYYDLTYGMPGKYESGCGGGRQKPKTGSDGEYINDDGEE